MSHKNLIYRVAIFVNFWIPLGTVVNMVLPAKSKIRNNYILVWESQIWASPAKSQPFSNSVGLGDTLSRIASRVITYRTIPQTVQKHTPNANVLPINNSNL